MILTFCHSAKTVLEKAKFCWQNVHSKIAYSARNSASRIYPKYHFNSFLFRWQDSHNQAWFMIVSGVRWLWFRLDLLFFLLVTLVFFEQLRIESELRKVCTLCVPLFFFRSRLREVPHCRASETRARVKITPREKRRHAAGREKNFSLFPPRRISLALLSLRKNGGLLQSRTSSPLFVRSSWSVVLSKKGALDSLCQRLNFISRSESAWVCGPSTTLEKMKEKKSACSPAITVSGGQEGLYNRCLRLFWIKSFFVLSSSGVTALSLVHTLQPVVDTSQFGVIQCSEVESFMTSVERVVTYTEIEQEPGYQIQRRPSREWPDRGELQFREQQPLPSKITSSYFSYYPRSYSIYRLTAHEFRSLWRVRRQWMMVCTGRSESDNLPRRRS